MRSAPNPPTLYPCEGLYDLSLNFGGELESLPQDCRSTQLSNKTVPHRDRSRQLLPTYRRNLLDPEFAPTAIRMAFVVGSAIFTINHGGALLKNEMTPGRWLSGALSFMTPYAVSIYSQTQCQLKSHANRKT